MMPLPTIRQVRQRFTDLESRVAALEGNKTGGSQSGSPRREAVQDTSTTRKAVSDGKPKSK